MQANRKELQQVLNKIEAFDGKFIKKLGEKSAQAIRDAVKNVDILPQDIQSGDGKKIDLSGLRDTISRLEENEHKIDVLESCPALEEYRECIEKAIHAQNRLREESGMYDAEVQAQRLNLVGVILKGK